MYATERHAHITRSLTDRGRVSVVDLARDLGVTTETIRRDLDAMEEQGVLRRVHGGAVPSRGGSTTEVSIAERTSVNSGAKDAIARRALEVITQGWRGSVLFDAGSTAAAVPVAHALSTVPGIDLTVLGGQVRGITAAAVGPSTVDALRSLRPDLAFVGTNGIAAGFGLSTPDPAEAAVKAAIVRAARRVIVLADADKMGVESLVSFADIADIDVLVTDAPLGAELSDVLAAADVEVWLA